MIRIDDCTHPTCCGGDCRKCEYNPKSGYSPYHYMPALPDTPATREARRQANILVATFAAGLLVLSMLPREAIMTWLRFFRFSRWHVPAAGTSRPSRPLRPRRRWHVSTFPAAGARRWHVSTFPPLVPAAGTSRPSRRWRCPPLARSPAAGTVPGAISPAAGARPLVAPPPAFPALRHGSRRWHVSTFRPLVPAAGTFPGAGARPLVPGAISGRWHVPGRWKTISILLFDFTSIVS